MFPELEECTQAATVGRSMIVHAYDEDTRWTAVTCHETRAVFVICDAGQRSASGMATAFAAIVPFRGEDDTGCAILRMTDEERGDAGMSASIFAELNAALAAEGQRESRRRLA